MAYLVAGDFFSYESGVYDGAGCEGRTNINHGVQVVDFNLWAAEPYLIAKNSWGVGWGDNGYFKMKIKEKVTGWNTCNFLKYNVDYISRAYSGTSTQTESPNDGTFDTPDRFKR